jgi:hypothetical protein
MTPVAVVHTTSRNKIKCVRSRVIVCTLKKVNGCTSMIMFGRQGGCCLSSFKHGLCQNLFAEEMIFDWASAPPTPRKYQFG